MEWIDELAAVAQASYHHPLRPDTALEVVRVCFSDASTPSQLRRAVDKLASSLASGDIATFTSAMRAVQPWRDNYLHAKDLESHVFPLIALEIVTSGSLAAVEEFLSQSESMLEEHAASIDIFLRVRVPGGDVAYLKRVLAVLKLLVSDVSAFRLAIVELDFSGMKSPTIDEVEAAEAITALALGAESEIQVHSYAVSFTVGSSLIDGQFAGAWRGFLHTLCRVNRTAEGDSSVDSFDGNAIRVTIAAEADDQLLTDAWMALALSHGFSELSIDDEQIASTSNASTQAMAIALFTNPYFRSVRWSKLELSVAEVERMGHVLSTIQASEGAVASVVTQFSSDWERYSSERRMQCTSRIASLQLELAADISETPVALIQLFPMIGQSMTRLTLEFSRHPLTAAGLAAIFESCPHLRELAVNKLEPPTASASIEISPTTIVSHKLVKLKLGLAHTVTESEPVSSPPRISYLAKLIACVSQRLEYLEIRRPFGIIPFTADFSSILVACPSLFHLKIECLDVGSLNPLVEAYRAGRCRLSSLYLIKCPVNSANVRGFAEFLSDRECVASHKLGVLHLSEASSDPRDASQLHALNGESLRSLVAMLEVNRTLTELYVAVAESAASNLDEPLRPFHRRFHQFDEQEIPLASEPMTMQERLAFMSVLQRKQFVWSPETVAHTFRFGAQRVRRSVRFEVINQ